MAENRGVQFRIEKQTEQACGRTEAKAVRFERTTINAVLQKLLHWTQLNVKEIVTSMCTRCGFSVPSFSTKLPKKTKFRSLNELNCSCCCCCFDIDHLLNSPHL